MGTFLISTLFWQDVLRMPPSGNTRTHAPRVIESSIKRKRWRMEKHRPKATIVIAPHPDDEVLCCSEVIQDKVEAGENVKIIFITDGDAYGEGLYGTARNYGRNRKIESKQAAQIMGVKKSSLFFLGFPDGMLSELKDDTVLKSPFTRRTTTSRSSYHSDIPYTKKHLEQELRRLLSKFEIQEIYFPSPRKDHHPDHAFVGDLTQKVLRQLNDKNNIIINQYVVHGRENLGKTTSLNERKLKLIQTFQSQFHDTAHTYFMERFAQIPEIFWSHTIETAKR